MGNLLISLVLISLIIVLFKKEIEIEFKILFVFLGYLLIVALSIIFNVNILIYFISVISVGLWLKYKANFNLYEKKWFLIAVCVLTFFSINAWAFFASGILYLYFDYGLFSSLIKGFKDMNNSFNFMVELSNELLLQMGTGGIPEELRVITESIGKDISKLDTLKTIIELLDYL